jgi:hypothetical protein
MGLDNSAEDLAADSFAHTRQFFFHALAFGIATVAVAAAALILLPSAALPAALLVVIEAVVVMGAFYRQRDLVQRLALEPDVSSAPAVRRYRARLVTQPARDRLAASINSLIEDARHPHAYCLSDRVALVEDQLRWVAQKLSTPDVSVQPLSLVTCLRLLTHGVESPLFNPGVPVEQLHGALLRIRLGFGSPSAG